MISDDDRSTLQPLDQWCRAHPDQHLTPAALEAIYGIPEATCRSWSDKGILPPKDKDGGYVWHTPGVPGWLAVYGGPLATSIRRNRTTRSIRETRNSL